jgi:hypothetical protein
MSGTAAIVIMTTGLGNVIANNDIIISPNPVKQMLSITAQHISRIQIMSVLGNVVVDNSYDAKRVNVDVGMLNPGIYIVKLNNQHIQKIIKE